MTLETLKHIPKWKQRVFVVEAIYSNLIIDDMENMTQFIYNYEEWGVFEKKIYDDYLKNKQIYLQEIQSLMRQDWQVERLNFAILAILLEAISEFHVFKTDYKVLIHQSIITAKKYGEEEYKLINAILDKYLKKPANA